MTSAELQRLVKGHDWLWQQWWPALLELSCEQARKEVGGSFPNIYTTTLHMVGAEWAWQERLEGNSPKALPGSEWAKDMRALKERWDEVAARRSKYLETADASARKPYRMINDTPAENTVAEIHLHVISHAHFHRGQSASQFRLLGLKPPSAHYIGFFRL